MKTVTNLSSQNKSLANIAVQLSDSVYNAVLSAAAEATVTIPSLTNYIGFVADAKFFAGFGGSAIAVPATSGTPSPIAYNSPSFIDIRGIETSTLRLISSTAQLVQIHFYS